MNEMSYSEWVLAEARSTRFLEALEREKTKQRELRLMRKSQPSSKTEAIELLAPVRA